jgi:hypothetical protein
MAFPRKLPVSKKNQSSPLPCYEAGPIGMEKEPFAELSFTTLTSVAFLLASVKQNPLQLVSPFENQQ